MNTINSGKGYITSISEMKRRKIAFISLEACWFVSVCLGLLDIIISLWVFMLPGLVLLALILAWIAAKFNKVHDNQSVFRVFISGEFLERDLKDIREQYPLSDIESIRIKRRPKGTIREIRFRMNKGKEFYINGIEAEEFERFKEDLLSKNAKIKVKTLREPPIDFDHTLFYPILGTVLGVLTAVMFRIMMSAGEKTRIIVKNGIAVYIISVGLYFVINRPTKKRYGNKRGLVIKDSLFGTALIIIGIIMTVFYA